LSGAFEVDVVVVRDEDVTVRVAQDMFGDAAEGACRMPVWSALTRSPPLPDNPFATANRRQLGNDWNDSFARMEIPQLHAIRATLDPSLAPFERDGGLELPWLSVVTSVA
jgi:hypothetical protein